MSMEKKKWLEEGQTYIATDLTGDIICIGNKDHSVEVRDKKLKESIKDIYKLITFIK